MPNRKCDHCKLKDVIYRLVQDYGSKVEQLKIAIQIIDNNTVCYNHKKCWGCNTIHDSDDETASYYDTSDDCTNDDGCLEHKVNDKCK